MSFIKTYGRCYQKFDNDPIIKTDPTYTAPTAKENLEYTGEAQELLNAGSTNDGIIKYSLDGTNWGTSVPTGTEALTYTIYWKLEGDTNHNDVAQATISVEIAPSCDYVEIGGIKWAKMNVGALTITDYGQKFSWGSTKGYTNDQVNGGDKNFSWADYELGTGGSAAYNMTKYNSTDKKTVLEAEDDAATVNMGSGWRMPTLDEFLALKNATASAWTESYQGSGVAGLVLTSTADPSKKLFFPAAGSCSNGSVSSVGSNGFYWSSSLYSSLTMSYRITFYSSGELNASTWRRVDGYSVRAVVG